MNLRGARLCVLVLSLLSKDIAAQQSPPTGPPPNEFPHFYPGIPNKNSNFTDSKAWQDYFMVKDRLPNATFSLERNFAGNLPVNRAGHPNNTLFFWAWEKNNGSLTSRNNTDEPWMIWLNGGPGSSSMLGLLFENGPIHVANNFSLVQNEFGWNKLADTIWIDQPVGTGFSTAESDGYIFSEDQMGEDFMGFLANLVAVFPSLAKRPLYLTGESYAGTYIPYITKTYFSMTNPPVRLVKIAIGDGATASEPLFEDAPVVSILETYPQLVDYDPDVFNYFKEQTHLCGYDVNLTYPMKNTLPSLLPNSRSNTSQLRGPRSLTKKAFKAALARASTGDSTLNKREEQKTRIKRSLAGRANGTIDPFYECFVLFELSDYVLNFTKPWSSNNRSDGFDFYDIPDALSPEAPQDGSIFLNDHNTRAALHAPTSKNWSENINPVYPFENNFTNFEKPGTNQFGDPSVEPMAFLSDLATNSSNHNITWVIYSGNDDFLVGHFGTEATIQNTTFGGITGFTQKPSTAWFGDDNQFAGVVHQERGITFVLFDNAGHLIPQWQPARALTFVREFILGNNTNGTVQNDGTIVGQHAAQFVNGILPGEHNPIFTGSGMTEGSTLWPTATIEQWDSFIASAVPTAPAGNGGGGGSNDARKIQNSSLALFLLAALSGTMIALL